MGKSKVRIPGSRNSMCEHLRLGANLVCSRDSRGVKVAGAKGRGRELQEMKTERLFHIGLQATRRVLDFVPHVMGNCWEA